MMWHRRTSAEQEEGARVANSAAGYFLKPEAGRRLAKMSWGAEKLEDYEDFWAQRICELAARVARYPWSYEAKSSLKFVIECWGTPGKARPYKAQGELSDERLQRRRYRPGPRRMN